jgi:outer membrane protein TolC
MDLIVARGELEQARVDLGQILGLSARYAELEARGDLLAANAARPADAALFDHALENRFDVRVSYLSAQRAEAALRLEMRRFLPDVQLGFAFERNERRGQPGRKILADAARESIAAGAPTVPAIQSRGERALADAQVIDAKLGPTIALALPLFDQNQAQIAKARARVLQSRKAYEAKCNVVAAEVERARLAHDRAAELLNYLRNEALPQATHTVEGAQQRYQAGEEGILTVIEAQDALVRRRRIYVSALRDFATTEAQLDAAVGGGLLKQQAAQAVSKN